MTVRQVIMVVTALAACVALLVVDSGASSDVNSDNELNIAEQNGADVTTLAPMP